MEDWNPKVLDGLARQRQVVLINNVASAARAAVLPTMSARWLFTRRSSLVRSGSKQIDVLGYSLGGLVAQQLAANPPELVRRLILAGTGPQGGLRDGDRPHATPDNT